MNALAICYQSIGAQSGNTIRNCRKRHFEELAFGSTILIVHSLSQLLLDLFAIPIAIQDGQF